jgi:hypothetical protein
MMAEVLLDAVSQVSGAPTAFAGYAEGTRAIELPDVSVDSYFLKTFGRPSRAITCECERTAQPSMVQVLHISNGDTINEKLTDETGRIAQLNQLMESGMSTDAMLDELFLSALCRFPTANERAGFTAMLAESPAEERRLVLEDIAWGVMSCREFLFNH